MERGLVNLGYFVTLKKNLGEKIFVMNTTIPGSPWYKIRKKTTRQIKKTAAKDALNQLQKEGLVLTREVLKEIQIWD